jgi:DME family drug/metabolite transporter
VPAAPTRSRIDPTRAPGPPAAERDIGVATCAAAQDPAQCAAVPVALILLAAALWALLGTLGTLAIRRGVDPLEVAFYRAVIGGALFAAHAGVTGARPPRGRELALTAGFGVVGVSVFFASYQVAVEQGGASLASVLLYTAPAFVAVLAVPVLGERLRPREVIAVAASVAGVAIVSLSGGTTTRVGAAAIGFGLVSALGYATYDLFGKRMFARHPAVAVLAVALPVGAVGLAPLVPFARHPPEAWALLGVMGVASTYLAYLAYATALRRLPATRASVIATVEPVIATGLAAAVLGERLAPIAYLGAAIVVAAAAALALTPDGPRPR